MVARRGRRKTVDVIVPAFNEEDCVEELVRRLTVVFDQERGYDWRALIVENGSSDRTWDLLQSAAQQDTRICVIRLSRNFRMDGGLDVVVADHGAVVTNDLQATVDASPVVICQLQNEEVLK